MQKVKKTQRASAANAISWHRWCAEHNEGVRDPRLHGIKSLQDWLASLQSAASSSSSQQAWLPLPQNGAGSAAAQRKKRPWARKPSSIVVSDSESEVFPDASPEASPSQEDGPVRLTAAPRARRIDSVDLDYELHEKVSRACAKLLRWDLPRAEVSDGGWVTLPVLREALEVLLDREVLNAQLIAVLATSFSRRTAQPRFYIAYEVGEIFVQAVVPSAVGDSPPNERSRRGKRGGRRAPRR